MPLGEGLQEGPEQDPKVLEGTAREWQCPGAPLERRDHLPEVHTFGT